MNLNYELTKEQKACLNLADGEAVSYCVPLDLVYEDEAAPSWGLARFDKGVYLVVTDERLLLINKNKLMEEYVLSDFEEIKCESQVNCGLIVGGKRDGEKVLIARFSMRHIERISYVVQGANLYCHGQKETVTSDEREKYCAKCGRALPGTNTCPYCSGGAVTLKKFWDLCSGYQYKLLAVSLLMVVSSCISLVMPAIQQRFIDNCLTTKTGTMMDVLTFVGIMLGCTVVLIIINTLKYWLSVSVGALISMNLRRRLYFKIQELSLSFINER